MHNSIISCCLSFLDSVVATNLSSACWILPIGGYLSVKIATSASSNVIASLAASTFSNNKFIYVLLSGFIFGGLHAISSITTLLDLVYLIPYCSLGFIFAYLYTKTDNIFSTIIAHSFHNGLALLVYLMTVML